MHPRCVALASRISLAIPPRLPVRAVQPALLALLGGAGASAANISTARDAGYAAGCKARRCGDDRRSVQFLNQVYDRFSKSLFLTTCTHLPRPVIAHVVFDAPQMCTQTFIIGHLLYHASSAIAIIISHSPTHQHKTPPDPSITNTSLTTLHISPIQTHPTMSDFKLYYSPTSCGAANYIVATLGGLTFDSEPVNIGTKKTHSGADYLKINPKGNVPTIVLSNGSTLNENIATLSFLADRAPASAALAPPPGPGRYAYLNALGFVNSELHPAFGSMFNPNIDEAAKPAMRQRALEKAAYFTSDVLKGNKFALGGDAPSAVDIYAYIVFTWAQYLDIDIASNTAAKQFMDRVAAVPGVKKAHAEMNEAVKA